MSRCQIHKICISLQSWHESLCSYLRHHWSQWARSMMERRDRAWGGAKTGESEQRRESWHWRASLWCHPGCWFIHGIILVHFEKGVSSNTRHDSKTKFYERNWYPVRMISGRQRSGGVLNVCSLDTGHWVSVRAEHLHNPHTTAWLAGWTVQVYTWLWWCTVWCTVPGTACVSGMCQAAPSPSLLTRISEIRKHPLCPVCLILVSPGSD